MEKQCTKCNQIKSTDLFYKMKTGRFGVESYCKICRNEKSKVYGQTDKGKEVHKKATKKGNVKYYNKIKGIYGLFENELCLYIGQSSKLLARINNHRYYIKKPNASSLPELYYALQQHQNIDIRIIEECSSELLLERERYHINTKKPLYNEKLHY